MKKNKKYIRTILVLGVILINSCGIPKVNTLTKKNSLPESFFKNKDTITIADLRWKEFFKDKQLIALIDSALIHNQELKIFEQEVNRVRNEIQAKKGEYLPQLDLELGGGVEKVGRYTSQGANDANTEISPGEEMPEPLSDLKIGGTASWEIDIWRKLRNARDATINRYMSSIEGQKFMTTNLVAEIASAYYKLLELDNKLALINEYVDVQNNFLKAVRIQKQAGDATELAVKKFEAEVLNTKGEAYLIKQAIFEQENKINYLVGRIPQKIDRNKNSFDQKTPDSVQFGIPSQLLTNRPDIRQAEYKLMANKLDVKVARAAFYPSIGIQTGFGLQAFNAKYFVQSPESIIYGLAGELVAPVINRKAIKANYLNANSRQEQAIYEYEQVVLNAFIETANQISKMNNLNQGFKLKLKEVEVLNESIIIANKLFSSAKADYMEVLIAQRDVLAVQLELIEIKKEQFENLIELYRTLGGGWK